MVSTPSTMLPLETTLPPFELPDFDGQPVSPDLFADATALVVVFMCNHCPFVKLIQHELANMAREYANRGVAFIGINSNDVVKYPDDAPEKMREEAERVGYPFPYVFDESQEVAKRFRAACTPDIFVFDGARRLVYRGQFDDSRPKSDAPVTGSDLRAALDAILDGREVPAEQRPSIGCNIKWKPGNEPDYFST